MEYSEARGYNVGIARDLGSVEAACVYNQLCYWQRLKRSDGWFYKSYEEMVEELMLSKYQLRKAYKLLEELGYIEMKLKKANGSPTLHFRMLKNLTLESKETSHSMDSEKTSHSTNNKLPINYIHKVSEKTSETKTDPQIEKIYRLYLKYFIDSDVDKGMKKYRLTPKRTKKIATRLKDAGYDMICAAVVGYGKTPFYNRDEWRADLADFICRSFENVEKGARLYEERKNESTKPNPNDPWANL